MIKKAKNKIIICLIGEMASGKDTVADYLSKKYKSKTISFSQPLRDILDRLYLPQTRINMAHLGIILRREFGQDMLSKTITSEIKASSNKLICLPNVRLKSDMAHIKKLSNFVLIYIKADPKVRYHRITKRSQNKDDKTKTWAQFLKDSKLSTETEIKKIAKGAKFTIDNNGDRRNLYSQVNEIMPKILK
ncbi:MAG: AAA family ATPase [Candidatus Buchananbacteria bacterium]|nr:AAA family ATPase [Candidatus Buchananbacteria bacterium]